MLLVFTVTDHRQLREDADDGSNACLSSELPDRKN